ncbi:MAG: hypothetical protein IKK21_05245 [Clostridia bacterium]|nr:hypothetical protein [Clostridia bacterium]
MEKKKLSKKAQRELNKQKRQTWDFSPVTRTVESKKVYNRKRAPRDRYTSDDGGLFLCGKRTVYA